MTCRPRGPTPGRSPTTSSYSGLTSSTVPTRIELSLPPFCACVQLVQLDGPLAHLDEPQAQQPRYFPKHARLVSGTKRAVVCWALLAPGVMNARAAGAGLPGSVGDRRARPPPAPPQHRLATRRSAPSPPFLEPYYGRCHEVVVYEAAEYPMFDSRIRHVRLATLPI